MEFVRIIWLDAIVSEDRWTDVDEARAYAREELRSCETVGLLLFECQQHISVCLTDGRDCVGPTIKIPRGCIVSKEVIAKQ